MIKTAQRYLEVALNRVLQRTEPLVLFPEIGNTVHAVDMFWLLLDIYSDSEKLLRDATAARDHAYAVWKSASVEPHRG
ncbi:hypothetical protein [Kribbella italica]|uniref:Uncharacterized protein n=1 Tax=Kribbella italica TaxID=1540520 RepID=A0A7W9MXV0_9ACTN|nr:hypothetical protein [Kribbella italica]MBB5840511.1 hypothetical protein [Kribbella italica]